MRLYIIAGEASGDLHASNLIRALKNKEGNISVRGFGGDRMNDAGAKIVKHYRDLAFMGFWEVLLNLKTILANLSFCKQDILHFKPDAVILVDYPGFNLRIAKFLKKQGIKVFYYISPQVWAWHSARVDQIKKTVDRMFVILPFEKEFYASRNYEVEFVGHPLFDALQDFKFNEKFLQEQNLEEKKIIALLPGSRRQEIKRTLPVMARTAQYFPDYLFVVAGLSHIGEPFYKQYLDADVKLVMNQTYDLLHHSFAALVTSGTATLETALFNVPQVVCYKGNFISYLIGRILVKVKFISLVNLVCEKEVVKELLQQDFSQENLRDSLYNLTERQKRLKILTDYHALRQRLGGGGASQKAAEKIIELLR